VAVLPDSAAVAGGRLEIGGIAVSELAARHGTPLHVYDAATLRHRSRAYLDALAAHHAGPARVAFACKSQAAVGVLQVLVEEGLGMDVASEGELALALQAGADPAALVVHGNNKSDADIAAAVAAGAGLVVVDDDPELDRIDRIAAATGAVQRVLVRVTPGIDADTHRKIATGHSASKFGLAPAAAEAAVARARTLAHVRPAGLHVHLGSQIRDLETFAAAARFMGAFVAAAGLRDLPVLDLGGGLAVPHTSQEDPADIGAAVAVTCAALADALAAAGVPPPELVLEPGRSIAGPAGVTLYTVGSVKTSESGTTHVAVDGGMSDNPRPMLYGAVYEALLADRAGEPAAGVYAVVGKHCESGDVLIERASLPAPAPGEVLVVPATGAYTASMASNYNGLPRPAAVLVEDGRAREIVRRETVADLLRTQTA
jgi:diaminopimelate decarboxylase